MNVLLRVVLISCVALDAAVGVRTRKFLTVLFVGQCVECLRVGVGLHWAPLRAQLVGLVQEVGSLARELEVGHFLWVLRGYLDAEANSHLLFADQLLRIEVVAVDVHSLHQALAGRID